jgi:hypothetical protein
VKRLARSARCAVLLFLAAGAAIVVSPPVAHADVPDCTDADRSHGSGLQIAGDQASITFTLARDCAIGLTSYEVHGKAQTKYDTAVANTAGTHTLTVALPPCYQVDFHPGAVHNRGEGRAIRWAKDTKDCDEVPPAVVPTTVPPTTVPPTTVLPTTSIPAATPPTVLAEVILPAPSGQLAATGSEIADTFAMGLMGIGLGLGIYRAGRWGRRRVFERSQP